MNQTQSILLASSRLKLTAAGTSAKVAAASHIKPWPEAQHVHKRGRNLAPPTWRYKCRTIPYCVWRERKRPHNMMTNNTTSPTMDTVKLSRASKVFMVAQAPDGVHTARTFNGQYSTSFEDARNTITMLTFTVPIGLLTREDDTRNYRSNRTRGHYIPYIRNIMLVKDSPITNAATIRLEPQIAILILSESPNSE